MSLDFDARFPRFRIGSHDRVTIEGKGFRLLQQMDDSFVLLPADGDGLAETFTFARLNALSAAGKVRHEVDHFLPAPMRSLAQPRSGGIPVSDLPQEAKVRLDLRSAMVEGFTDLYRAGEVKKTEASIAEMLPMICEAARPYLEARVDLAAMEREVRARNGQGRRSRGGTLQATISPVHPRTLLEWVRANEAEGKAGLADRLALRGNRKGRLGLEETALLALVVRNSWLSLNRPSQARVIENVRIAFRDENLRRDAGGFPLLKVPGRHAVRSAIKHIDPFQADVARFGVQEAIKRHRPVGRGINVSRPLERVEIDECRIDLKSEMFKAGLKPLFTEEELETFGLNDEKGQWWLCVAIDCRTRVILGMRLVRNPNTSAAINVVRMIMSDKGEFSDATDAKRRWSQFGVPEMLVADNGPAFKSLAFTDACNDLGVTLKRTIAGAPAMRGTIERFFRTYSSGLLERLPGRTFSDRVTRAGHPSEARACLGPEDLCFALVRWVTDIYHNTPHEGLGGRTPLQQWEADHASGNFPVRAVPDAPARRRAFGTRAQRTATLEGITYMGVRYHSAELARSVLRKGPGLLDIRWDAEDIGAIEVCIDREWQPVPAVHGGFDGLHAQVWIAARRALKASGPRHGGWEEDVVFQAIKDIEAMCAHRSLQFGLIDKSWTDQQLEDLEATLFSGFRITQTVAKTRACGDGQGRTILPQEPGADRASDPELPPPPKNGQALLRFED